ncbi:MAG: hypothetical protein MZV63_37040 [Marinilabiliales bacterium]|nr:hypothetical protein [Marinilabiliales bacterium]
MKKNRRLDSLRLAMKERGVNVYLIPLGDPHMGEYISDHWQTVKWLTGFTGSAASACYHRNFCRVVD